MIELALVTMELPLGFPGDPMRSNSIDIIGF
jgi:hypothetical protein